MSELGFWKLATAHPDNVALVTPDGTRITAGELLAALEPPGARPARARPHAGRLRRHAAAERRRR